MLRYLRSHVKAIMIAVIALFVVSCFAGYGLYSRSGRGSGGQRDYAVAEVNGKDIMRSDIEKGTTQLAEQMGSAREITSADIPFMRKAVLDSTAIEAELEKEIKNRKIEVTDEEIDEAYTNIMDSYPTREEFKAYIERSGVTEAQLKSDIKKQISQKKIVDAIAAEIKVSDDEARKFYNSARTLLYKEPAGFKINMATFKSNEAAKAAKKALDSGEGWDKVIELHKADIMSSTPYNKPVLIGEERMINSLAALKDLPLNTISPVTPVTDTTSYIAIKRSKEAEKQLSYNEVSADVVSLIRNQKAQGKQQQFYKELLSRAKIKILDPEIFPSVVSADVKSEVKSEDKQ
ncbi:MAG: SurA N-terminal domain-containing protein [Synergistaceae bacterium]|nr:SurA N-terminal domain-containing protein [Synergistaceae bacterium]